VPAGQSSALVAARVAPGSPPDHQPCLIAIVLPRAHRLRRSAEFGDVVRRGSRVGSASLVLHARVRSDTGPVRVGFVVGRGVGNAVLRNTVKRRLRHLVSERLDSLPAHSTIVLRANPSAAVAGYDRLRTDLDASLETLARRLARR